MVQIDDNGVGRTAAQSYVAIGEHLSFSSGANAQRMSLLNQLKELNIDLQILDKMGPDGVPAGTTVQITLTPLQIT